MKGLRWIDRIPIGGLAIAALLLGLAPFHPQPHLAEKVGMLWQGTLSRPIDIFDLFFHGAPTVLLVVRLLRRRRRLTSEERCADRSA
ncbi:MAG: RND transporter [Candidatus Latescibacterota bacterium]